MIKALKSTALILAMVLSGGMVTGCAEIIGAVIAAPFEAAVGAVLDATVGAAIDAGKDASEEAKYNRAAEIVIQYDEIESF